ncbi:MAG TPA: response regulator, partial [Thermoanaerobaculia bacterium]|nr:response regulator [Thermoanaerobaculia bacterium]
GVEGAVRRPSALVVDDDESVRSLIRCILRRQSFDVDTACDPDDGLAMLETNDYDVVVLDLRMNDRRALAVLEYLRDRAPRAPRRIVIVTAAIYFLRHDLPAAVCRVLAKPFDIDDLATAVSECAGDREN